MLSVLVSNYSSFSAITFPMNIRSLFKWRRGACARSSSSAHSQYLRDPSDKRRLADVSDASLSAHDEQNGKRVLSCSPYLYQLRSIRRSTKINRGSHFSTPVDPSIHSVLTRTASHRLALPCHYRVCQRSGLLLVT